MTTNLPAARAQAGAVSAAAKPRLPGFLVKAIDPDDRRASALIHPWQPPAPEFCARHKLAINEALASLTVHCERAPERFVLDLLARCAQVKFTRDGTPAEWEMRAAEYLRLLGHYPADIWQAAVDGHMLSSRFFPDISELEERMAPELSRRLLGIKRLEAMQRPAIAPPPEPTPEERKAVTAGLRRLGAGLLSGAMAHLSEAEALHYCKTGEYPPGWDERSAAPPGVSSGNSRPPSAASKRRRDLLQADAAAARARLMGGDPSAETEGSGEAERG